MLVSDGERQIVNAQKDVEIKLTAVFIEHNIPFRTMDHLVDALKSCIIDSKVFFFLLNKSNFLYYIYLDFKRRTVKAEEDWSQCPR